MKLVGATNFLAQIPLFESSALLRIKANASLDDFITSEYPIALQGVLSNIGSTGSRVGGAAYGLVIASPSKANPNYFYTWTRDSALTMKALIDAFIFGDASSESAIQSYIYSQAMLQAVPNPSGQLLDGTGLGDPKFEADGTAFQGDWGRPQRDGPALRATTFIAYSRYLIANNDSGLVTSTLWPIISNDLNYVGQYWNQTGFGLWEEVNGSSFFTTAAQYRALVEGNGLAVQIGQTCAPCVSQAPQILCFLQNYWNCEYVLANINVDHGRTSKDVNGILGAIHSFDPSAKCDDLTFQPCSSRALANHKAVTDTFRSLYGINSGIAEGSAVAVGRYQEDVYVGGNPWYLATLAAAEQLYDALYQWKQIGAIAVTETSQPFFKDFLPNVTTTTYVNSTQEYASLMSGIRAYADGFFSIVQTYTPEDGSLAEQFSRNDGTPISAPDLTWSYTSFLTAVARRNGQVPAPWGEPSAKILPNVCYATSARGTYTTPTATAPLPPCSTASAVAVMFNVRVTTVPGENIFVSGSIPQLGGWDTSKALALSADAYQASYPRWWATVELAAGTDFEYKYIVEEADGRVRFEEDPNRSFSVPVGCARESSLHDQWDFDSG